MSRPDRSSPAYRAALGDCLRWDIERDEPYLQPPSFPNLRIVPARAGTEDQRVSLFNEPHIGPRLFRLPYPYPRSHAEERLAENIPRQRALIDQLKSILPPGALVPNTLIRAPTGAAIPGSPFTDVWDVETGTLVGNFNFSPHTDASYADEERVTAETTQEEMLARPPAEQVWYFGYVLSATAGGKGVMGEVVGCVVDGWVKPWTGIGTVGGLCNEDNPASAKVMMNNGFTEIGRFPVEWPKEKGGHITTTVRYERKVI